MGACQGLTLVLILAQLEHFLPPYDSICGEAALHRKFDLRPVTLVPRFGESIDRQKNENVELVPRFRQLTDHQMEKNVTDFSWNFGRVAVLYGIDQIFRWATPRVSKSMLMEACGSFRALPPPRRRAAPAAPRAAPRRAARCPRRAASTNTPSGGLSGRGEEGHARVYMTVSWSCSS